MTKKIVWGALLVGLIGILVTGAVIRTVDKTGNVAEARGLENGRGRAGEGQLAENVSGRAFEADLQQNGTGGYGQGRGQGRGAGNEGQYPNLETVPADWATIAGTVFEAPAAGGDLVIKTDSGDEVAVGTGPGYMESQGFVLEAGERVQVEGYWEDDEFKAARVTRLQDGQSITLRDNVGRPAWAGNGRRATEQQAPVGQIAPDQGGIDQGGFGGQGRTDAPGDGAGTGQAQVDAWLTLQGTVTSVDTAVLVMQAANGQEIVVENRPWWFAQEQGFSTQVGDELTVVGFYENDEFEVGGITNLTTGQAVSIREDSGRPLWAGRGRRGS
jgi:hypothetical protein